MSTKGKPLLYLICLNCIFFIHSLQLHENILTLISIHSDDGRNVHVEFTAFGKLREYHVLKSSPPILPDELPVITIDKESTKTQYISLQEFIVNMYFFQHGIEFYRETEGLGVFILNMLQNSNNCFALNGIVYEDGHYLTIEPDEHNVNCSSLSGIRHLVHRRRYHSDEYGLNLKTKCKNTTKRFLLDGIASHPDSVLPIPGNVDAKVEILAWTDMSFTESFQKQLKQKDVELDITKYIATVVHAANVLYQHAIVDKSLNVSLYLTGAVICKIPDCSRFTSDLQHNNSVDNHKALDKFAETLKDAYTNSMLSFHYDYAVAFTRDDLTDPHGTPVGVSFTDDICSISDGKSSSIIEDQGGYSCIGTFVHEVAHILGSDHDGYFRGKKCDPSNGFLMASFNPLAKTAFYFSQCTVNSIKENLLKPNASCVFDTPHINHRYQSLSTELPGQIYNVTEQCRQIYGTSFCLSIGTKLEDICYKMYCWDPHLTNVCSTKSSAAPGTSCGHKKWCSNGECVYDARAP
ncbi:A disintegrin and metalloproteinase with thrombospondin motifs 3-like [Mytilus trossulus]|uniref:A disintegrin and metalloproteinase with thrombospondin motifs 3-like n=1 Tax=Mytilus trossulus TaxID=6551 RepID=UPI0030042432